MVQSKIKTCNGTWTETVTETDPWTSVTKRWKEQNVSIFKIQVRGEKLLQPNKNDYFRFYGVESKKTKSINWQFGITIELPTLGTVMSAQPMTT